MRWTVAILALISICTAVHADTITVSAAISLKESLTDIRKLYETSGDTLVFNFDASGKLAAQIQQGAPVDLFISADDQQMDKLQKDKQIDTATRRVLVTNTLVLIAAADEKQAPADFTGLATTGDRKIAIGEPKTVPAGRYAMQTLQKLQLDQNLKPRLVYGQSVREVLTLVQRDEVVAGLVYGTDAKAAGDTVKVIAIADATLHDPIEYPAAVVSATNHDAAAKRFLEFLSGTSAHEVFARRGFSFPDPTRATTRKSP